MKSPHALSRGIFVACSLALAAQGLIAGCGGSSPASTTTSTSSSTGTGGGATTGSGGAGTTAGTGGGGTGGDATTTTATTGSGGAGGASSGTGGSGGGSALDQLESLLIGEWEPTFFQNGGGNPPEPAPPGSPFTIFQAGGKVLLGCGQPPSGTWVLEGNAPAPAIAQIKVVLNGNNNLTWYVVTLDKETFVFGEGGDLFSFKRSTCP
jgi:hypothetical protein